MNLRQIVERRHLARQKSFLRGCVYFNQRRNSVDCLIRDISDEGARIVVSETINVPDLVDLYIPQKEQTLRAHVAWRRGDELGVDFMAADGTASAAPASGNLEGRVAKLESQVAALRRMLRQLKSELPGNLDDETF